MKRLAKDADIDEEKVYPHNLRHLFALSYYEKTRDVSGLSDILGHSSLATTRIYLLSSEEKHRAKLESLMLVM